VRQGRRRFANTDLQDFSMTLQARLSALTVCLMTSACASLVTPNFESELSSLRGGEYTLDPEHAYLNFRIEHLGLSYVVGRFNELDASLDFDPDDPASLSLEGIVDVATIDFGNEDLDERIAGSGWLDAERFPQAVFTATDVTVTEDDGLIVVGDFTLRGVTLPLTLTGRFGGGADNLLTGRYTLGFSATGEISRSAYGVSAWPALVGDAVSIELHAEFQAN
jgi:polyisoprenoid-binding protein YceI